MRYPRLAQDECEVAGCDRKPIGRCGEPGNKIEVCAAHKARWRRIGAFGGPIGDTSNRQRSVPVTKRCSTCREKYPAKRKDSIYCATCKRYLNGPGTRDLVIKGKRVLAMGEGAGRDIITVARTLEEEGYEWVKGKPPTTALRPGQFLIWSYRGRKNLRMEPIK